MCALSMRSRGRERDLTDAQAELERLHEGLESSRAQRFRRNDQIISLNAIGYQQSICERNAERLAHLQEEARRGCRISSRRSAPTKFCSGLRSRQQTQYLREAERREQLMVDDLVMARFAAKMSEVAA